MIIIKVLGGDYLIKYIFIILICLIGIVMFALLKSASDFDDEVEEFYNNFYEDNSFDEEYCYNRIIDNIDNNEKV